MLHARPTMLTKFLPLSHSLTAPFLSPPRLLFPKPLSLSLLPAAATLDQSFSYGPSLHKGHKCSHHRPPHLKEEQGEGETEHDYSVDRDFFTRAYDIAALRVPSDRCFDLESRLRGHLLNWPRIRNIARVPGEDEKKNLSLIFFFLIVLTWPPQCLIPGFVSDSRRRNGRRVQKTP